MNEDDLSREAGVLGIIGFSNGLAFEAMKEITGKTVFSWIGTGQSTFWSILSASCDDGAVSLEEGSDIHSHIVG